LIPLSDLRLSVPVLLVHVGRHPLGAGHVPPRIVVIVHEDLAVHVPHRHEPGQPGAGIRHRGVDVPQGVWLCRAGAQRGREPWVGVPRAQPRAGVTGREGSRSGRTHRPPSRTWSRAAGAPSPGPLTAPLLRTAPFLQVPRHPYAPQCAPIGSSASPPPMADGSVCDVTGRQAECVPAGREAKAKARSGGGDGRGVGTPRAPGHRAATRVVSQWGRVPDPGEGSEGFCRGPGGGGKGRSRQSEHGRWAAMIPPGVGCTERSFQHGAVGLGEAQRAEESSGITTPTLSQWLLPVQCCPLLN
uniref:Uncharacterized protein n=1 Tax=Phasianus colchicus TaxID=9054 RepID=A0A669R2N0_PHACC